MTFLKPDGSSFTVCSEDVLGLGQSGIVLRKGDYALKIAKVRDTTTLAEEKREDQEYINDIAREILENEYNVYQRVGKHRGVAECIERSREGILMVFYEGGNLDDYILRTKEPSWGEKRDWILSIIETVAYLHESRVLVDDLALRNFVIAKDFSLRMVDLGQCAILPLDSDVTMANVDGLTAKIDIFHLGCLIFSLAAWQPYEYDGTDLDPQIPPLHDLPEISHLPCADILYKCWTGGYASMNELRAEADQQLTIGPVDILSLWLRRCGIIFTSLKLSLPGSM